MTTSVQPKEGMTILAFLGRGSNSRPFYGESGRRYLFGGRHHLMDNVLNSDVAYMLKTTDNGKPVFQVVKAPVAKVLVELNAPVPDEVKALFPEGQEIHVLDIVDAPVETPVKKSRKKKVTPDA